MTFDPWTTHDTIEVAGEQYPATLYKRAMKRVENGTVLRVGGNKWRVQGGLGDTQPTYTVSLIARGYECSCYSLEHGDTRRRRTCSHVLAVLIQRSMAGLASDGPVVEGVRENGDSEKGGDKVSVTIETPVTIDNSKDPVTGTGAFPMAREVPNSIPPPNHPYFNLPDWVEDIRPHQWDAVQEIVECYRSGSEIVWLDAPTGTGKTLVAELVRMIGQLPTLYVCSTKTLQEQFIRDYPYAKLLKGRSNYPTQLAPFPEISCADCSMTPTTGECNWCNKPVTCEYQMAKRRALASDIAVLNTAYLLTEANYVGNMNRGRGLVVVDECDVLERELMGFVEFRIGERMIRNARTTEPRKGSHKTTIADWLCGEFLSGIYNYSKSLPRVGGDVAVVRNRNAVNRVIADVLRLKGQIEAHPEAVLEGWVRDNDAGPMVLKPVQVGEFGQDYLWKHSPLWLCMSATIISPDELSQSLGCNGGDGEGENGKRWSCVTVPMTFPVENRQIKVAPVADMSKKGKEAGEWEYCVRAISRIAGMHPTERILVHTVSYELTKQVVGQLLLDHQHRSVLSYSESRERDSVLDRFKRTDGAILVAPSMDRGVDLREDECRVVIVAKVPFPNLGDRQISERTRTEGGQQWYTVQTIRSLVQMTGRATRSIDDWSVSYILDRQFVKNIWKKHRHLVPKWWAEALDFKVDTRGLIG